MKYKSYASFTETQWPSYIHTHNTYIHNNVRRSIHYISSLVWLNRGFGFSFSLMLYFLFVNFTFSMKLYFLISFRVCVCMFLMTESKSPAVFSYFFKLCYLVVVKFKAQSSGNSLKCNNCIIKIYCFLN